MFKFEPHQKMLLSAMLVVGFTAVLSSVLLWLAAVQFQAAVHSARFELKRPDVARGADLAMRNNPESLCGDLMVRAKLEKDLISADRLFLPFCREWDSAKYDGLDGAETLIDFANILVFMGVVIESIVHLSPSWRRGKVGSENYGDELTDRMEEIGTRALALGLLIELLVHLQQPLLFLNRFHLATSYTWLGSPYFVQVTLVIYVGICLACFARLLTVPGLKAKK
jgi:hypothetical protein